MVVRGRLYGDELVFLLLRSVDDVDRGSVLMSGACFAFFSTSQETTKHLRVYLGHLVRHWSNIKQYSFCDQN